MSKSKPDLRPRHTPEQLDGLVEMVRREASPVRQFDTGATRNADIDKPDYDGFFSPLVVERFGRYMHKHRLQADGELRAADNWQKGIPQVQYMKSLCRHGVTAWTLHRDWPCVDEKGQPVDLEEALCGILFNTQGYLHELLKAKEERMRAQ